MPEAIGLIADVIFDALSVTAFPELIYGAIYATVTIAMTIGLSAAAQALAGKKAGSGGGPQSRDVTARGTVAPRQVVYGQVRTGGILVYFGLGGPNGKFLFFVIALAGHQSDSIGDVWLDSRTIKSSEIDPSTGVVAVTASAGSFWNGGNPTLWIFKHLGTSAQAVDAQMNSLIPEWDTTHRGAGITYLVLKMQHNEPAYPSGAPSSVFSLVSGRRLYDPRLDSTNGGTGTQRVTDATTWTFSSNWALAVRDYISGGSIYYDVATPKPLLTLNELNSRIDDSFVITAANHADENVTVPIPYLGGTLIWTHSSAAIVGTTTQFTYQLAAGNKLLGPDSLFYTVLSITDDTHLTLTAVFAGTTTTSGVTTQFNTTASTTVTQKRYTADTQLSCGDTHATNMSNLLTGGIGHISYAKGKYRMYAGVYDTPTLTITADDIVGPIEVATHPQGEDLYNQVSGTFYDELRGWQASSFPTQQSATYQTTDGGIFNRNITLSVTRTSFRCQRIANCLLQQSRNKLTVTLSQVGPAAMNIAEWETFQLNIPEYGWSPIILRCITWKFLGSGFISIVARAEASASYADLATANYQILAGNSFPLLTARTPDPPQGLTATTVYGGILFSVTEPAAFTTGSTFVLWESTSSSPFSSATQVASFTDTSFILQKTDGTERFYWVTVQDRQDQMSTPFPVSTGLMGSAGMPSFVLVPQGATVVSPTSAASTGVTTAWDTHKVVSSSAPVGGVFVSAQMNPGNVDQTIGITNTPTGFADTGGIANVTAGWQCLGSSGSCKIIYLSAAIVTGLAAPSVSDVFVVFYDGFWMNWLRNGAIVHQEYSPQYATTALYLFGDMNSPIGQWQNVAFGPVTNATPNPFFVATSGSGAGLVHDSTAKKTAATTLWDTAIVSLQGYTSCHVQAKMSVASQVTMVGLTKHPRGTPNDTNADYAIYNAGGSYVIMEAGTNVLTLGIVAQTTDLLAVTNDSTTTSYIINGTVVKTTAAGSFTLFAYCPMNQNTSLINSLSFGPGTALDTVPTASIDPNAVSTIGSNYSATPVTVSTSTSSSADIITLTVTTTGGVIEVDAFAGYTGTEGIGGNRIYSAALMSVYRDGSILASSQYDTTQLCSNAHAATQSGVIPVMLSVTDSPAAGSHTYTLHFDAAVAGTSGSSGSSFANPFIKVREIKR